MYNYNIKLIQPVLGPLKKYVTLFWTKFDPSLPSHKLSHMAKPPIKTMSQATITPPPYVYDLTDFYQRNYDTIR